MTIVDCRVSIASQINPQHARAQHRAQMMGDETVATADIKHFRSARYYSRDLQRHVVSAADFSATPFTLPTALQATKNTFK